ncbi:ABC transporter permease [Pyrococcus kukulkanii]|uniref:fluoroquinolone export ABC transporter permease subunit n=1 Tax=Pyrococcus kukulkanii TaxID=1609559 RepID=UPI00082A91F7|nr:ABC transporter permease [Pyrococcus kukulkanii]
MNGLLKVELKVGVRSWVYPLYLGLALAYALMIRAFPQEYRHLIVPIFLLMEPGIVGFTFVGAILFMEKRDNVISALAVSPLKWRDYVLSKALIMALVSLVASFVILGVGAGIYSELPLLGAFLTSLVYTLLGIAVASRYRSLDEYFVPILVVSGISFLPFLYSVWPLKLLPSYPALVLFKAPFQRTSMETVLLSVTGLMVWAIFSYNLALRRCQSEINHGT